MKIILMGLFSLVMSSLPFGVSVTLKLLVLSASLADCFKKNIVSSFDFNFCFLI